MFETLLKYLTVIAVSAFKVIPGMGFGMGFKFNALEMFITLALGCMSGVLLFTFLGKHIQHYFIERRKRKNPDHQPKINFRKARRILRIWHRYGIWGIAFLTPPLISPPFGTLIAVGFRESKKRILLTMGLSILFWSAAFALLGDQILNWWHHLFS